MAAIPQRWFYYSIGFLLGCGVMTVVFLNKQSEKTHQALKPFRTVPLAEIQHTKNPLDPMLALFHIEEMSQGSHEVKRILIFEGTGPSGFVRVEEIISQSRNKETLMARNIMAADQLVVEMDGDIDSLKPTLKDIQAEVEPFEGNWLIQLKTHAPNTILKYTKHLQEHGADIVSVSPRYLNA